MICDAFLYFFLTCGESFFRHVHPANNQKCAPDSDKRDVFLQYDC